jgi:hypothetical protein
MQEGHDRRNNHIGYRHILEKNMVHRSLEPSLIYSEARRGIALRVEIDKQRTLFSQGKPAGKIDCGRGLADATLLIDYRDRLGQDNFLRARCFTWNTIPKGFVPRGT